MVLDNRVLDNRVTLLESQVLKKEDLYTRWEHATKQEIAELCEESKLRTYLHHKGPINGVLFCIPAYVWHDGCWYNDENITYFLLEDVEWCEKEYPDFVGNVSPGNMTFQENVPAEEVRKQLGMSPIQFVDMLNGQNGPRLVTSWEEWYRAGEYHWFETDKIKEITVHRFDLQGYLQERAQQIESVPNSIPDGQIDFSAVLKPSYAELEEQLAASQKQIEENSALRQWNKRLNEQNQELRVELEKTVSAAHEETRNIGEQAKTSIHNVSAAGDEVAEELQAELEASNTELGTTTRTQAATEARQDKVLGNWQAAFKIMVPVILQCHAEGEKKRTKTELQVMCSKHGRELSVTQLDFLRDCLPDEHVNREGGATVQG